MAAPEALDTHHKALSINLDDTIFGSFAEIGAGQEVARWFLKVGAASGTVAKTISAYDKEVSDDLYGAGSRYVSQQRLQAMMDQEWKELLTQLSDTRGPHTRFFSFVDTVSARNYAGTNLSHGWIGLRFQQEPGGPPNDVILHVNLKDPTNLQQQDAIGILGVNLIFACFHERTNPETFLKGIALAVAPDRMEIDFIELHGEAFGDPHQGEWERQSVGARLIYHGIAEALIFTDQGTLQPASEIFHKKTVVLAPGTFSQVEAYHAQMMTTAVAQLQQECGDAGANVLGLFCISMLPSVGDQPWTSLPQALEHIRALNGLKSGVMVISAQELYRMSAYVKRFTDLPLRFVVGISVLVRVFEHNYQGLAGSTLEGIARLFSQNVKLYAYPMPKEELLELGRGKTTKGWHLTGGDGAVTAEQLRPAPPLSYLYEYLLGSQFIVPVEPAAAEDVSSAISFGV